MDKKKDAKIDESMIKAPTLTLSNLLSIASIAITLALAWATFSARVAVLENEVLTIKSEITQLKNAVRELEIKQRTTR